MHIYAAENLKVKYRLINKNIYINDLVLHRAINLLFQFLKSWPIKKKIKTKINFYSLK